MSRSIIDIPIGSRFGRLVVIRMAHPRINKAGRSKEMRWECICDCGKTTIVNGSAIRKGVTRSCGCLWHEAITKHGMSSSPEYHAWLAMRQRCESPKSTNYADYGERGITVCERWRCKQGFSNFLSDMGARPVGMSLDRYPNNDGNYEPKNCRWATRLEQLNNTRHNTRITANGETHTLSEWSRISGIKAMTIRGRLLRKWSPEDATRA